jgi:hypothetical protein
MNRKKQGGRFSGSAARLCLRLTSRGEIRNSPLRGSNSGFAAAASFDSSSLLLEVAGKRPALLLPHTPPQFSLRVLFGDVVGHD